MRCENFYKVLQRLLILISITLLILESDSTKLKCNIAIYYNIAIY